ncbi:unnamed protein product [Sphagnum balticum]
MIVEELRNLPQMEVLLRELVLGICEERRPNLEGDREKLQKRLKHSTGVEFEFLSDEEVTDSAAHCYNEARAHHDEEFGGTVADRYLPGAADHQIKGFPGGGAEIFTTNRHHYISLLCQKAHYSLEASDEAGCAFYEDLDCPALADSHSLILKMGLTKYSSTVKASRITRMKRTMAMSSDPKAIDPRW